MTALEILFVLGIHLLIDFFFQKKEESENKHKSWRWLLSHTITYSIGVSFIISILATIIYSGIPMKFEIYSMLRYFSIFSIQFALITFVVHTVTDYITSRETKKLLEENNTRDAVRLLGVDQYLHHIQLVLTYILLIS